jgi:hypothetical protein
VTLDDAHLVAQQIGGDALASPAVEVEDIDVLSEGAQGALLAGATGEDGDGLLE